MLFPQRAYDKKDVYNLNEDEELTHFGQSLAEMENLSDFVNSDDESEERGLLSGEIKVRAVFDAKSCLIIMIITITLSHPAELTASHFGGGGGLLRKKTSGDQQEEDGSQRAKSRQELIEELILKSKQEKVSASRAPPTAEPLCCAMYSFARLLVCFLMFSGSDKHRKRKRRSSRKNWIKSGRASRR